MNEKDTKLKEAEEDKEQVNAELYELTKNVDDLKEKTIIKNDEIEVLIGEKNSLDELRMKAEEKTNYGTTL